MKLKWVIILLVVIVVVVFVVNGSNYDLDKDVRIRESGDMKKATFAGGCFWCIVGPFEEIDGVVEIVSGYTGGKLEDPAYEDVSSGMTGHAEAIQITYDPEKVKYGDLLDIFWRQIDPTDSGGQFVDRGHQYRTAIFYHDEEQKRIAEESKKMLYQLQKITTHIVIPECSYRGSIVTMDPGSSAGMTEFQMGN